ncbi:putative glutathione transferase [Helianthus annuus]|nr:putative glutathione transferase [Helianthus annuus]
MESLSCLRVTQFLSTYVVHFREWLVTGESVFFSFHILVEILNHIYIHRYPSDPFQRSKIHSVLDWNHSNLRQSAGVLVWNTILAPQHGLPLKYPLVAKESEKLLVRSLSKLEDFWLKDGQFLVGSSQPSIADIRLACEIMQLEVKKNIIYQHGWSSSRISSSTFWLINAKFHMFQLLSEKDYDRILKPYKKVVQWIEDTKRATAPHFDEVHGILFKVQKRLRKRMATEPVNYNDSKSKL